MRYFFYGSLTDLDVLGLVLGRQRPPMAAACLDGWRRWRVAGACYPLIVPAPGETVDGVVADVSAAEARRLAWYEGEEYEARELAVVLASGEPCSALVFLPRSALAHAGEPWDAAQWRRRDKPALLEATRRWMALEGRRPAGSDGVASRRDAKAR